MREQPLSDEKSRVTPTVARSWMRQLGISWEWFDSFLLGLSSVANFDSVENEPPRYGLKGITSFGRRRVRNAAWMMAKSVGRYRLTFATVTLPELPPDELGIIQERWHEVVDNYRREMSRKLKRWGLSGELVGVTEIQEKRYAESGFPVLHLHTVFVGMGTSGGWAIRPEDHDRIWRKSIQAVFHGPLPDFGKACQLASVEKDVEGYLGKYMSKGSAVIAKVVADGYDWVLPKQWWNCSRSLVRKMSVRMRFFSEGTEWLVNRAADHDQGIWAFYAVVEIDTADGEKISVGSYGRLTPRANRQVREFLGL